MGTFLCMGSLATRPAWSQFDEMVKHVPSATNAIFLVNAEKVFSSQIAKDRGWEAQRGKRFDSGLTCIPPKATQLVIACQIDVESLHPAWEAAVVEYPTAPSLQDIKQYFGGLDDTIDNTPVIRVADNSFVARFSDQMLGAFGPSNRQLASRWVRQSQQELSPYLGKALSYADAGTAVIFAVDATDAITPALVQQRLEESASADIKNAKISLTDIAQIVGSLKGVMFGITFGGEVYGKIRLDFGQDASPLADIAKPLLLAAVVRHGAMIDEFTQWKAQTEGKTIYFGGPLNESGLTRITSLVNLPTQALHASAASQSQTPAQPAGDAAKAPSPPDPQQLVLETTQAYYKSIERLQADLKGHKGQEKNIAQIGFWFEKYANRVDRLPILNVDEQMFQYGQYVAQQLRNASMAIKGFGINKSVAVFNAHASAQPFGGAVGQAWSQNGSLPYGAYGWARREGPGGVAYAAARSARRQATEARVQATAQLTSDVATQVQQIAEQLREAQEQIRVMMTKKYKVEF
jgi:hypothetical protein